MADELQGGGNGFDEVGLLDRGHGGFSGFKIPLIIP